MQTLMSYANNKLAFRLDKRGSFILLLILCKHAYCIYLQDFTSIDYYKFGSTGIMKYPSLGWTRFDRLLDHF